jgi:hypothetical protein
MVRICSTLPLGHVAKTIQKVCENISFFVSFFFFFWGGGGGGRILKHQFKGLKKYGKQSNIRNDKENKRTLEYHIKHEF